MIANVVAFDDSLNLFAGEVLTITRSVRKRLDFEKPVPRHVLLECLELAIRAPQAPTKRLAVGVREDPDQRLWP